MSAYEACSLAGALGGYLSVAWPLIWGSGEAPWSRRNAPTSTTGGGGFLLATVGAFLGACLMLWMCDGSVRALAAIRAWQQASRKPNTLLPPPATPPPQKAAKRPRAFEHSVSDAAPH